MTAPAPWTIGSIVKWATDDFRTRGIEKPRLDAEVIVAFALKTTRMQLLVESEKPLAPEELVMLRDLVKRRRTYEPVAYLRGEREFYGRSFKVDKRVLVPRPDTETLVEVALNRSSARSMSMRAADICTGSGCVGITLARERKTSKVALTDVSVDALRVARENALGLGAYNVMLRKGDLFGALKGCKLPFDVIASNPPYIPTAEIETLAPDVKDFEPRLALDGGDDGLSFVRRLVTEAPVWMAEDAVLAMEIGAGEAQDTAALFEAAHYRDVRIARDYGNIERVVSGLRPPSTPRTAR